MDSILSAEHIFRRYITLPLDKIKQWSEQSSFQIDALGLVTLLGAEEVNLAVGNLQQRQYTECLPTLAAYVIAGDRFTTEQSGFVIYNLSDGITTTELKGWFTRWLMSQPMNNATTVFEWQPRGQRPQSSGLIAPALSFILVAPLLACAILIGDWYGVGTALAIILSIFVRLALLSQLRHARNKSAAPTAEATELEEIKDLCVIRCDGKMATIKAPASVLNTFTKDCEVEKKGLYKLTRQAGWLIFGVQVCILGMCTLFTQLYTVVLLVLSTWALSSNFPRDMGFRVTKPRNNPDFEEEEVLIPFSADWVVNKTNHPKKNREKVDSKTGDPLPWDRRKVAWARLGPDEKLMSLWNLFPYEANKEWRDDYNRLKAELRSSANEKRPGDLVTSHLISPSSTASTVGQSSSNLPQSKPEVPQHSTSNPSSLGTSTTNSTVVDGNTNALEPASHL